jgi:signal transduction histidine kinase
MAADLSEGAFEHLAQLNRALLTQHLLRGLAHDLRNDLQVLTLGAGPVAPTMAARLDQAIEGMSATLDTLGRLGRFDAEEDTRSELGTVLAEVSQRTELMRNFADAQVTIDPIPPRMMVAIPPGRLGQILLNLVAAAKAAGAAGIRIWVTAQHGDRVELVIDDDGGARPSEASEQPGAGIGWWMAAALLRHHGGSLTRATLGANQVTISLPLSDPG